MSGSNWNSKSCTRCKKIFPVYVLEENAGCCDRCYFEATEKGRKLLDNQNKQFSENEQNFKNKNKVSWKFILIWTCVFIFGINSYTKSDEKIIENNSSESVTRTDRENKEKAEREAKEKGENEAKEMARIKALRQPPEDQVRFYMIVSEAQNQYKSGENAMAKGAARFKRAQELCKLFQNKSIAGWIGVVNQLSSNQEGRGVLSISFGNGVQLTTWNNIVSDSGSNTLIDPRSELFNQVVGLSLGSWVKFDGSFFENKTDCIREKSLTLEGSILKPEYIFKFKKISLID